MRGKFWDAGIYEIGREWSDSPMGYPRELDSLKNVRQDRDLVTKCKISAGLSTLEECV